MEKEPIKIGIALSDIVSALTGEKSFTECKQVFEKWEEITGPKIALHTQVKGVKAGELLVDVSSAIWAVELSTMSNVLLERVNAALGKKRVKSIRFTINPKIIRKE